MSILLLLAAAATTPHVVRLPVNDRWALISGLENRVGGHFILSGLKGGDETCRKSLSCVATSDLTAASGGKAIKSVDELVDQTRVYDEEAVAVVSVRGARRLRNGLTQVLASVYDRKTGRWTNHVGMISSLMPSNLNADASRKITAWNEVDTFDLR